MREGQDVVVYLFSGYAKIGFFSRKWVRKISIDAVKWNDDGKSYQRVETLCEGVMDCNENDPATHRCLIIQGKVVKDL